MAVFDKEIEFSGVIDIKFNFRLIQSLLSPIAEHLNW